MAHDYKLSVQSLDESLKDLVHWERVAIHLPEMSQSMIDVIKKDHPGNNIEQKLALYDRWLRACPHATWSNVVDALETAEEMRLAGEIQTKVNRFDKTKTSHENTVTFSEKVDEGVVTELKRLNKQFQCLEEKTEEKCNQLVKSNTISLDKLANSLYRLKNSYGISNLHSVTSTTQLFDVLSCHYTFLDCDLLKEVLDKLPDSADLCSKLKLHQTNVSQFKRKTSIRQLHNKLQPYVRKANMKKISLLVLFELEDAWGQLDMSLFEVLLKTMFPNLCKKMKWYEIESGSEHITILTVKEDEEMIASLITHNQTFLGLMGVTSIKINGEIILSINKTNHYSFDSALLEASLSANTEALLFLLNEIKVSVDHQDKDGNTALDIAVVNNHIEVTQILLDAKANLNHQRDDGNTPFHIACYKGYTQLALMLIKYGANPSIPNTKGDTPFLSSIRGNMMEVVTMIAPKLPQSQIPPALLLACRLGYSDIISFLLQYIDPPGSSTIHQYCANGDLALAAEYIVQFCEDINSSLVLGITPLMIASSCGHIEVIECLMEANADVNCIDKDGYSPLAYAITGSGSVPVIECLLQAGANPCITVGGDSLLQMAKQQGNSDLADLLRILQFMALHLYNMFSSLVEKIQEDLISEIDQHKITLQEIKSKLLSDPEFSHIEGIAEASSCSELFTILQPHYDFLSWKVISCLSERLKLDGYFKQVEIVEGDLAIQSLPQAASLFPQQSISLSSTDELSVSLDKQWGDKTLFNLRGLNSLLFSSLARLMSHLTVSVTQQEIIVSYQIPRSTKVADRIKLIILQRKVLSSLLGIASIKLNSEVILQIGLNKSFSFHTIILNSLLATADSSLPSNELSKTAKFLFKFKNIDYSNADGVAALQIACHLGNKPVTDLLLSNGAPPNTGSPWNGFTPLMSVSLNGHFDIVKAIVNKCPSAVNTRIITASNKCASPLLFTCFKGHIDILKFLLENGADPNILNSKGSTLLFIKSVYRNIEIMKLLLEAGTNPRIINDEGFNALMIASFIGNVEGVKLLLSYNADYKHTRLEFGIPLDAFTHACASGSKETVDVYLSNTDLSDKSLSIGWYMACLSNNVHLIGYLVNSLPQLSIGRRELVTACVEGDLAYIRNNRGNLDDVFVHGVTPLMIACSCDNTSIVEALLNAGASAIKKDKFGKKAIDYCKEHSSIPDILRARFGNEPMKRTFDKEKLFKDIVPVTAQKGIPAVDEHFPLSNTPFTF